MAIDRNDPEVKALIEEITAEATEALSAKNRELLGELKAARAKAKGEISHEEHAALQQQLDDVTAKLATVERSSKGEITKLTKERDEKDGALRKHLIDGALTEALAKAGVSTPLLDAVKALHQSKASINVKDGVYEALIDGKPLTEFVTSWAQSDQGKHFIAAPNNGGGGSQGGAGKPGAKTMARTEYDAKQAAGAHVELKTFFAEGGTLVD